MHEKSILLALVPIAFLMREDPALVTWLQLLGTFTMFPLLVKDGLRIPYVACCSLAAALSYSIVLCSQKDEENDDEEDEIGGDTVTAAKNHSTIMEKESENEKVIQISIKSNNMTESSSYSPTLKHLVRLAFFTLSYTGTIG